MLASFLIMFLAHIIIMYLMNAFTWFLEVGPLYGRLGLHTALWLQATDIVIVTLL